MVGYGSAGRYAGRPAYDDLIQAHAAIPTLPHRSTGQPRFIPMAAIDRMVGSAGANALLARARTGIGQQIEVPMSETIAQFVLSERMQGQTFDPPIRGLADNGTEPVPTSGHRFTRVEHQITDRAEAEYHSAATQEESAEALCDSPAQNKRFTFSSEHPL